MEKGRQVQIEWSRFPSRNREVSEVFSDRGPEGEAFESPSLRRYQKGVKRSVREDAFRGAGLPRFGSLLVAGVGLVLLFSFIIGVIGYVSQSSQKTEQATPVSKKQDRHSISSASSKQSSASSSQPSESSSSTKEEKSESEKKSGQLTADNSPYIDGDNGIRDFNLDELLVLSRKNKLSNVTAEELVNQYGKAKRGYFSDVSADNRGITLQYELPDNRGNVSFNLLGHDDKYRVTNIYMGYYATSLEEPTKTTEEFRALFSQNGQEIHDVISQMGTPEVTHFSISSSQKVYSCTLSYSTVDNEQVSLNFEENSEQWYLKGIAVKKKP